MLPPAAIEVGQQHEGSLVKITYRRLQDSRLSGARRTVEEGLMTEEDEW